MDFDGKHIDGAPAISAPVSCKLTLCAARPAAVMTRPLVVGLPNGDGALDCNSCAEARDADGGGVGDRNISRCIRTAERIGYRTLHLLCRS